jgi:ribose transport system permease protein
MNAPSQRITMSSADTPVTSSPTADPDAVAVATGQAPPPTRRTRRRMPASVGLFFQCYGVLLALLLIILFFSLEKPDAFPTMTNLRAVLAGSAGLAVLAAVLTVPMIMGDFDLSVGYHTQVLGAIVVTLMAFDGYATGSAIIITLGIAAGIGLLLGALIAWSKVSAFVITLGAGILFQGIELRLSGGKTIFEGLSPSFVSLASHKFLGFTLPVWIALATSIALWYVTRHTVLGRYMAAVGGNQEAARLSGINVERMRTAGFLIVGIGAAIAAVIITSQAASAYPNSAAGLLIPAYAGVFLGAAVLRPGEFHIWGTLIGVVFMSVIQNGLTIMNYSASTTNIIQGGVFIGAVLMSRIGNKPS